MVAGDEAPITTSPLCGDPTSASRYWAFLSVSVLFLAFFLSVFRLTERNRGGAGQQREAEYYAHELFHLTGSSFELSAERDGPLNSGCTA
jgi:hypothetical protein